MAEGEHYKFIESFQPRRSSTARASTTIDGVRADWPDGWGLVRASNTTPVLVLRFDADNDGRAVAHPGGVPRAVAGGRSEAHAAVLRPDLPRRPASADRAGVVLLRAQLRGNARPRRRACCAAVGTLILLAALMESSARSTFLRSVSICWSPIRRHGLPLRSSRWPRARALSAERLFLAELGCRSYALNRLVDGMSSLCLLHRGRGPSSVGIRRQ